MACDPASQRVIPVITGTAGPCLDQDGGQEVGLYKPWRHQRGRRGFRTCIARCRLEERLRAQRPFGAQRGPLPGRSVGRRGGKLTRSRGAPHEHYM
ncbi:hypothetical protein RR48_01008 [Papilio machaon]|uniref:Uncharacterized protein n=1 Tax=Papilio machaon TaxID=76193 RepID=A0A0N1ICW6_PAPMA|nr:hypothetical protein RR48_01008 [Papilio machaon]